MSWISVLWPMSAGACLAFSLIYLAAGLRPAGQRSHLAFAAMAASFAAITVGELLLMRAQSAAEFGAIMRWVHVPVFTGLVAMVVFVRNSFGAGRLWLAYVICGLRSVILVLDFAFEPNFNYREMTGLERIEAWAGETISLAHGIPSPWAALGPLSELVLLIYIADAARACWRRGGPPERRRALVVGGSLALLIGVASVSAALLHYGVIRSIYWISTPFLAVLTTIAFELGGDVVRSARLGERLQRIEADLHQSQQLLEQAAEAAHLASWEWDIEHDEIRTTERGRKLFGIDAGVRLDLDRFLDALHPGDRNAIRARVMRSLESGGSFDHEFRVVMPDGEVRWIATRGRVASAPGAKPTVMRGVSFDISKRKRAEEGFRRVVDTAPNGMIVLDCEGLIVFANARAQTDFGYAHEELIGQPIEMLVPERVRARHAIDRASFHTPPGTSRRMANREVTGRHRSGREIPVEITLDAIHTPAGPGVLATVMDVSERKQRDERLRKERAFLWQVIDINPCLIFAKDREGRFTLANQALADLYGTTVHKLIGRTEADFNRNTAEVAAFRDADRAVMDTLQDRLIAEERLTDHLGQIHWLQTVKRPILDQDGVATQILGVSTDITARKQTELELGRQRNELAHLARVTMLSELSGSLAHELNQPLAAVLSNAQAALRFLAREQPDLDEIREILADIVADDRRAGEIIHGLRLLLKKGELRYEAIDLNESVGDVLRLTRSDLLNAGVELSTELAPSLPKTLADRVQLQQVLLNLVVNACEAMSGTAPGERRLRVGSELTGDGELRVSVIDHGRGIPAANMERLFEPFFTTRSEGLGLGLSVCRKIIVAHGGRMWAENNPGGGASFRFTLPAVSEDRR